MTSPHPDNTTELSAAPESALDPHNVPTDAADAQAETATDVQPETAPDVEPTPASEPAPEAASAEEMAGPEVNANPVEAAVEPVGADTAPQAASAEEMTVPEATTFTEAEASETAALEATAPEAASAEEMAGAETLVAVGAPVPVAAATEPAAPAAAPPEPVTPTGPEIAIRIAGAPSGRVIGVVDAARTVFAQSPSFTRERLGTIDPEGIVRLPGKDGEVGEPVAILDGIRIVAPTADKATAPVLGFVNDAGEVRPAGSDRVLGIVDGADPLGMAFFALGFRRLVLEVQEHERDAPVVKNKQALREKIQRRAESLPTADVLGDVGSLVARLDALAASLDSELASRRAEKERLVAESEALADSTDWRGTSEAMRAHMERWKQIGSAGKEADDTLWGRFRSSRDAFHTRRKAHFEERETQWAGAKTAKELLIARAQAIIVADPRDYRVAGEQLRDVQAQWKAAGSAGRANDDAYWAQLQAVTRPFYDERAAWWAENATRKEALVARAEELSGSTEINSTANALKALQAEWKTIGTAGKETDDALWTRFRAANQGFFDRRTTAVAEQSRNLEENLAKKLQLVKRAQQLRWAPEAREAANEAKALQAEWKAIGPVPRERSDVLWKEFREACDKIFANVASARARAESDFTDRLKDAMDRKLEQFGEILRSMDRDQEQLDRVQSQLTALPESDPRRVELQRRVKELSGRVADKQRRSDDIERSLFDIRDKIAGEKVS